jgi:hypothetical protein
MTGGARDGVIRREDAAEIELFAQNKLAHSEGIFWWHWWALRKSQGHFDLYHFPFDYLTGF